MFDTRAKSGTQPPTPTRQAARQIRGVPLIAVALFLAAAVRTASRQQEQGF